MRVFVINQHGEALMPCKPRKAKILLRKGKAKVISRFPFINILLKNDDSYFRILIDKIKLFANEIFDPNYRRARS